MNTDSNSNTDSGDFSREFEKFISENDRELQPGKVVPGKVVDKNREYITVDIGFKSEGIIPTTQFRNSKGEVAVQIDDEVDVYILALENATGEVVLSYERAQQLKVWHHVEEKFKNDEVISGRIVQKVKGGLQVDIGIPAFLPGSQIDVRPHRNLDKFLGEESEFKVLKITKEKGNIVISRRAVLMSERESMRKETLDVLSEGVVMEGVVKNLTDYGAFVDLGGIDGLLHVTDISWSKINHPSDRLSVGDKVPVVVLKYDRDSEKVSLGMKQLKDDPWNDDVEDRFTIGSTIKGKVSGLADYGAFIEVEDGIEGLIHVSEMSWTKKVRNPSKILSAGEEVEAVVLGVDSVARRISLGLKQLTPNPWERLHELHPIGSHVKGKVKSITDFGIFIGVEDGIDGLVHITDFSWTKRIKDPSEIATIYKKGDEVEALVLDIDIENERLSLGVKQLEDDPWDTISQRYPVGAKVKGKISNIRDFGVFLEIEEGIEGLVHKSELDLEKDQGIEEVYKTDQELEARVTGVDKENRKISLTVRPAGERGERGGDMSEFTDEGGIGINFGELLDQKIKESQ